MNNKIFLQAEASSPNLGTYQLVAQVYIALQNSRNHTWAQFEIDAQRKTESYKTETPITSQFPFEYTQ